MYAFNQGSVDCRVLAINFGVQGTIQGFTKEYIQEEKGEFIGFRGGYGESLDVNWYLVR